VIWFIKKPQKSGGRLFFYVPRKYYDMIKPDEEHIVIILPKDRINILNILATAIEKESEKK